MHAAKMLHPLYPPLHCTIAACTRSPPAPAPWHTKALASWTTHSSPGTERHGIMIGSAFPTYKRTRLTPLPGPVSLLLSAPYHLYQRLAPKRSKHLRIRSMLQDRIALLLRHAGIHPRHSRRSPSLVAHLIEHGVGEVGSNDDGLGLTGVVLHA